MIDEIVDVRKLGNHADDIPKGKAIYFQASRDKEAWYEMGNFIIQGDGKLADFVRHEWPAMDIDRHANVDCKGISYIKMREIK